MLAYEGGRTVHVGHEGGMPGFLSGVYVDRAQKVAAAALGSSGTAGEVCGLPHPLIRTSLEHDPRDTEPWTPGTRAPKELASVLGPWWTEGSEFVFSWRDGHLEARAREAARDRPPAVFAPESEDVYRAVSGREHGEQLRLTRDDAGDVVLMHWATYRVTREQETFDRPRG
jgi:hypothetical protein